MEQRTLTTRQVAETLATKGIKKSAEQIARLAGSGTFQNARKDELGRWLIPETELNEYLNFQKQRGKQRRRWLEIAGVLVTLVGILAIISVAKDALDLVYTYILPKPIATSPPMTSINPTPTPTETPGVSQSSVLHIGLPSQPVFPLLVPRMTGLCNDFLIYEDDKVNQAFFEGTKTREVPQVPWLPGLLTFYLQAEATQSVNRIMVIGVNVEQRGAPEDIQLATFETVSICASSPYEEKPEHRSLGMVSLHQERSLYPVTGFGQSGQELFLDGANTIPLGIYLAGMDPGLYHLRLSVEYRVGDSDSLTAVSEWFTSVAVSDKLIRARYIEDINYDKSTQATRPLLVTRTDSTLNSTADSTGRAWFTDLSIDNLVSQLGGEYLVLRNHSSAIVDPFAADRSGMAPHYGYSLSTCDGLEIAALSNITATLPIAPGQVGRIGLGAATKFPPGTVKLPIERPDFGTCVMLEWDEAPVSQFPAR